MWMGRVERDVARESSATARALQTLAIPADNSPRLSLSAKQNLGVAIFRYSGVEVEGTGFGPLTAGLWLPHSSRLLSKQSVGAEIAHVGVVCVVMCT